MATLYMYFNKNCVVVNLIILVKVLARSTLAYSIVAYHQFSITNTDSASTWQVRKDIWTHKDLFNLQNDTTTYIAPETNSIIETFNHFCILMSWLYLYNYWDFIWLPFDKTPRYSMYHYSSTILFCMLSWYECKQYIFWKLVCVFE